MSHYNLSEMKMTFISTLFQSETKTGLDKAVFILFQIFLFLTPVFFIPSASVPVALGKTAFIILGTTVMFILYLILRLKDRKFEAPKNFLFLGILIFAISYALAAFFSGNVHASVFGQNLEVGTLAFVLSSLALLTLIPLIIKTKKDVHTSLETLFWSFAFLALFQVIQILSGSFGGITTPTFTPLGKWNDMALFFGLAAISFSVMFERAGLSRVSKTALYAGSAVALFFLIVVNFQPVWIVLSVLALVFSVYELSTKKSSIPYHALFLLAISIFFAFSGTVLSGKISNALGTTQVEFSPSWQSTFDISKAVLHEKPFFGVGPERFDKAWIAHKPVGILETDFWNIDFGYGAGFIPSLLVTTGLVGFFAALLFFFFIGKTVARTFSKEESVSSDRFIALSLFFGSMYLWILSIVYVPSPALLTLAVFLTGLLIGALREGRAVAFAEYSVPERVVSHFFTVLLVVLALIAGLAFAYSVSKKLVSGIYMQKGVIAVNTTGNLVSGEKYIGKAAALSKEPAYFRSLSELYIIRANTIVNGTTTPAAEATKQFQNAVTGAIQAAGQATVLDSTDYKNYISLGRAYGSVVPLNIDGAYDGAKKSYEKALELNPESLDTYLELARLELAHKDAKIAESYVVKALEKKNNYIDAIYLLGFVYYEEGFVSKALSIFNQLQAAYPEDQNLTAIVTNLKAGKTPLSVVAQ